MSRSISSFLIVLFRSFVFSLWAGGVVFFFSPQASAYMGNVCLHPMEQMALFSGGAKGSGKNSYKSQIRRLNKSIRAIDRRIDKQKSKLKEATDALGNSLSGRRLGDDSHDVADSVTDYIQGEQNGWDCQELLKANNFLYPPFFLPGIFGSLLPLIWEAAPVYAVAPPQDRRKGTVAYQQSERESTCNKSGGKVIQTGSRGRIAGCDCKNAGKGARLQDGKCMCPWEGPSGRILLPCTQVKKIKDAEKKRLEEARKKRLEEERRRAGEKASDQRLIELAKSRKNKQVTNCKKKFPGFIITGMKNKKCLCDWKSVEPKRKGNALCEYIQGHRERKALKNCKVKYGGLDVVEAIFRGPQNRYLQCMCRWDKLGDNPGDNPLISCNELQKIKKGEQSKQEARETCRSIYGSSVTWAVPNTDGPECYCGGKKLCSTVYNKCKTTYGDFKSLGKKNTCMCLSKDSSGRSADALVLCKYEKKDILPAFKKCKEKYSGLKVVGGSGKDSSLKCDCFYNGKTDSCGKIQETLNICRKRHKKANVTKAISTGRGTYCYCGGNKLCGTIYSKCKAVYGKVFTHIDSENDCMCGDQTCDELRRGKISSCKQYESLGYTEFKNGHCMCGNKKCKDKQKGQKTVDPKCFKKFPGLAVIKSLDNHHGLQCQCLHKGRATSCDRIQNQLNQTHCLNQYGKHLKTGVKKITFKRGRCYCDDKLCGLLGDPQKSPASAPVPAPEEPDSGAADDSLIVVDEDSGAAGGPPITIDGGGSDAADEQPPGEGDSPPVAEEAAQDTKEPCKKWQKKKYFKRKGRVKDRAFCSAFASSKKDCKDALEDIRKQIEKLDKLKVRRKKLEKFLSEVEDKKFDAQFSDDEDEDETEMGGLCTKCLADLRRATGPSGWQRFGSGLSIALGAGLSIFGLREARLAQNSTNELLALQGMPAENNFGYSMAGLSLGYPFVARGLHGLTHGNTSSLACNRHASPYQHPFPTYPKFY